MAVYGNTGLGVRKEDAKQKREDASNKSAIFLSYARGDVTTPFTLRLKARLEMVGWAVWMDEARPLSDLARLAALVYAS